MNDDLKARVEELLVVCGVHDFGVDWVGCACPKGDYRPVLSAVLDEAERLTVLNTRLDADNAQLAGEVQTLTEQLAAATLEKP